MERRTTTVSDYWLILVWGYGHVPRYLGEWTISHGTLHVKSTPEQAKKWRTKNGVVKAIGRLRERGVFGNRRSEICRFVETRVTIRSLTVGHENERI